MVRGVNVELSLEQTNNIKGSNEELLITLPLTNYVELRKAGPAPRLDSTVQLILLAGARVSWRENTSMANLTLFLPYGGMGEGDMPSSCPSLSVAVGRADPEGVGAGESTQKA